MKDRLEKEIRFTQKGFTFRWITGQNPVLIRPDSVSVPLDVQTNVPFMYQAYHAMVLPAQSRSLYQPPPEDEEIPDPQLPEDEEFVGFPGEEALDIPPTSLEHMLTHEPKFRQGQVCIRAKLKRTPARRVHTPHRGVNFGDRWSIDHMGLGSTHPKGIGGAIAVLTIYDDATGFGLAYPCKDKTADSVLRGLRLFAGEQISQCKRIRSDGAPERELAIKSLTSVVHEVHLSESHSKTRRHKRGPEFHDV